MKAFPALRLLACASLLSFVGVTKSSAQLSFHVVDLDSPKVNSNNNLGVAVYVTFNFQVVANVGTLTLTIKNLAGTSKVPYGGTGNYTSGILTGFGFDLPGSTLTPDIPVVTYTAGLNTFTQSSDDPDSINFAPSIPFDETNPEGSFDFGAVTTSPHPIANGLAGGKTATFVIKFGGDLTNFNETGFFSHNGGDSDFGFRFQSVGARGEGSDKFVYYVDENPPIPEPSTYGLVAAGLLVALVGAKRLKARSTVAA